MSRTVRIEVTAEDIAKGVPGNCSRCPVALAARRIGFPEASVGDAHFYPSYSDRRVALPERASEFVFMFDAGHGVCPFSFDLELP